MGTVAAIFSAISYGAQLALAIFQRRNQPDMLAAAHAAQLDKVQAKIQADVASQDTKAVEDDIAGS